MESTGPLSGQCGVEMLHVLTSTINNIQYNNSQIKKTQIYKIRKTSIFSKMLAFVVAK